MAPSGGDEPAAGKARSSLAEGLARHYSKVADDARLPDLAREAALLYSVAEGRLDGGSVEELEEALEAAGRARELFQELGDASGLAHARRLLAHARTALAVATGAPVQALVEQEEGLAPSAPPAPAPPADALDEQRAADEEEADELLEAAELHLNERLYEEARCACADAVPLFRRLGDRAAAARCQRCTANALQGLGEAGRAKELAEAELERCREAEDLRAEATMLLCLAELRSRMEPEASEEALRVGVEALELFQQVGDRDLEASTLLVLANAYGEHGDKKEALRAASDGLVAFRALGDREGEAKALHALAVGYKLFDRRKEALQWSKRALDLAQELGDSGLQASVLCFRTELLNQSDDPKATLHEAEEALRLAETAGKLHEQADALVFVVHGYLAAKRVQNALEAAEAALRRFSAGEEKRGQAVALQLLAQCRLETGDADLALEAAREALEIVRQLGDVKWEAEVLRSVSAAELGSRQYEEAGKSAQDAVTLMQGIGDSSGEAVARLHTLVQVHMQSQQWEKALEALDEALRLVRKAADRAGEAYALITASSVNLAMGRLADAEKRAEDALDLCAELGEAVMEVDAVFLLSQVALAGGGHREAARRADEAVSLCRRKIPQADGRRTEITLLLHLQQVHQDWLLHYQAGGGRSESRLHQDLLAKVSRSATTVAKAAQELGDKELLAAAKVKLVQASMVNGRLSEALEFNNEALTLFHEVGDELSEGNCLVAKAQLLQLFGRLEEALDAAEQAKATGQKHKHESLEAEADVQIRGISDELKPAHMQGGG